MPRDVSYQALILKKQPFGEGDEIVTCFTREGGKLRFFAKSTKLAKSRLQYALQALFLVQLTATGSLNLPKIIHVQVEEPHLRLREHMAAIQIAYYAVELLLKFTADGQKNEELFDFYRSFFSFLNLNKRAGVLDAGLAAFKITLLDMLGYGVHYAEDFAGNPRLGFSNRQGGFGLRAGADFVAVRSETFTQFLALRGFSFANPVMDGLGPEEKVSLGELQELLSGFIRYHLERDVKSERFLEG